jgi:hypothetical protein
LPDKYPYSPYLCIIRTALVIFIVLNFSCLLAQEARPKFDRKEEIIYEEKLYRLYNNYVTFGAGFLESNIRKDVQRLIGFDFNFHIRRQYFQAGISMSGAEFLSNNNVQAHFGYGLRRETARSNFAVYGGLSYFTGVVGRSDSTGASYPLFYQGTGLYVSGQAITKLAYDLGGGVELTAEYSRQQRLVGLKFILFFSSAYVGNKKNFNPNVRSENRK